MIDDYLEPDAQTMHELTALTIDPETNALLESLVSMWITAKNKFERMEMYHKTKAGDRDEVRLIIAKTIIGSMPDQTRWEMVEVGTPYDVYLLNRRSINRLTQLDLTRAGLKRTQFSTDLDYQSHLKRILEAKAMGSGLMKQCRECAKVLPKEKFGSGKSKGIGLVCNACTQKAKRKKKGSDPAEPADPVKKSDAELEKGYAEWLAENKGKEQL